MIGYVAASIPVSCNTGDTLPHMFHVFAFPVDALAICASMENIIVKAGLGFETIQNILLGNRCQHTVANQTSNKRVNRIVQVEAMQDLIDLAFDIDCTHPVAMADIFDVQETAVTGQHDALVVHGDIHHLRVLIVVAIETVKTQQTHAFGKFAQIHVQDEAGIAPRCFAQSNIQMKSESPRLHR